jgi:hypothetical protein
MYLIVQGNYILSEIFPIDLMAAAVSWKFVEFFESSDSEFKIRSSIIAGNMKENTILDEFL